MKKLFCLLYPVPLILILQVSGVAQTGVRTKTDSVNEIRSAAHRASGNSKDVLASFFQLAFNDLTTNREFNLNSNLFAIKLKTNPSLSIDTNFVRQTFARNSNIMISVKLDTNFNFTGAKAGYKYAIVNNRDYAVSKLYNARVLQEAGGHLKALRQINTEISARFPDSTAIPLVLEINSFFNDTTVTFGTLSPTAQQLVKSYFLSDNMKFDNSWNARRDLNQIVNRIMDEYHKKLLWTVAASFVTNSSARFTDVNMSTEATAGMLEINPRNFIEFTIKADLTFSGDSLTGQQNLKRQVLTSQFGFNWVNRGADKKPFMEFEAAGGFDYIPNVMYPGEQRTKLMFTGTFRIRISNQFWIPVDIKYDPGAGKVFGFLSVRSNFDLLNRLFGRL